MPTIDELRMLQALPLEIKILKTQQRIREWVEHFGEEDVYVSFSGGKDSTVLLHLVRELYPNIKAIFVNTGLEYPEIVNFVKTFDNVEILQPKMNFVEVIKKYGYPLISKEIAQTVSQAKISLKNSNEYAYRIKKLNGTALQKNGEKSRYNCEKYKQLLYVKFNITHKCCDIMKKKPFHYIKEKPIIATMTSESFLRQNRWLISGCNAFNSKKKTSQPMSFWTEQDVLQYIKQNNLQISEVYGEICETDKQGNQMICGFGNKLTCSGCQRTGCVFCLFGAHLDTLNGGEFRINRLKRTHPKLYDFCMRGGEFNENGIWQPKNGLGYWYIIKEMNKLYDKKLKNGIIKHFYPIKEGEIEKYEKLYNDISEVFKNE